MKHALLATTLLALPLVTVSGGAHAQPVSGVYVGLGGGGDFPFNEKAKVTAVTGSGAAKTQVRAPLKTGFDTGVTGVGSIGYGFGNGLRLEIEGDYRRASIDKGYHYNNGITAHSGSEKDYGAMANALFDFDIGSPYVWPYVGVGAGYQRVERRDNSYSLAGFTAVSAPPLVGGLSKYSRDNFAYQGIVGVSLPIPYVVGLSATIEYRLLDIAADKKTITIPNGTVSRKNEPELTQSALIGLRYAFDVAPPAPPPAPAPAPAPQAVPSRSYLVFFDWDRADLTARARQIVGEAAQNYARVQSTRIEVDGHADRSGTPAYNQRLSQRRAETVAAELVRDGVPRNAISIMAFGDTKPLVATAAGVREPQNRRVEIILH